MKKINYICTFFTLTLPTILSFSDKYYKDYLPFVGDFISFTYFRLALLALFIIAVLIQLYLAMKEKDKTKKLEEYERLTDFYKTYFPSDVEKGLKDLLYKTSEVLKLAYKERSSIFYMI